MTMLTVVTRSKPAQDRRSGWFFFLFVSGSANGPGGSTRLSLPFKTYVPTPNSADLFRTPFRTTSDNASSGWISNPYRMINTVYITESTV